MHVFSSRMMTIFAGALFVVAGTMWSIAGGQVQQIPVSPDDKNADAQPVKPLMQAKLVHAQRVLEGVVTHDFSRVERSASALKLMSLEPPAGFAPKQDDADSDVYEHFRTEFLRVSARLEEQAKKKSPEGMAYMQQNLTATCVACHDYIRDYESKR
ncbi:MAG: hypothetical protein R3C19_02610 [Planctomycetaceae bacterium]